MNRSMEASRTVARFPGDSVVPAGGPLLAEVLSALGIAVPADLVSGPGSGSTTLWKINAAQTLVLATTRREAAIDDAYACGRIAATAALTAVHAVAATPLFARMRCECPAAASDLARRSLVEGAAIAMRDAGAVLADARLIDAPNLLFDVTVAGIVRPDRLRGAHGARPDDVLILAGQLGAGIYAAAHAKGRLDDDARRALIDDASRSNAVGIALGRLKNVHAIADVGPGGLIAAVLAMARSSGLPADIDARRVPALPRALALAKAGCVAATSSRNWNRDGGCVDLADNVMPEMRSLLTDPQTNGALLIACKRESVDRVLKLCAPDAGAAAIGTLAASPPVEGGDLLRRWVAITG